MGYTADGGREEEAWLQQVFNRRAEVSASTLDLEKQSKG